MTEELYKPPGSITLDQADYNFQIRLGIQGMLGTGKTWAALTFNKPIVLSLDKGLISHVGRADVQEMPFYNPVFVDGLVPRVNPTYIDLRTGSKRTTPPNKKDAIIKWMTEEAPKIPKDYTLVMDGSTGIQAAYHTQYWVSPKITKGSGEIDAYAEYKQKIDYFTELMMLIKSLNCNVIYIAHEIQDRDSKGNLNGSIRTLLSGQFCDELGTHFSDWFRARVFPKPKTEEAINKMVTDSGQSKSTVEEWIKSVPSNCDSIYLWQTQSDNLCNCKTSLVAAPKYVIANASVFQKYKRKVEG